MTICCLYISASRLISMQAVRPFRLYRKPIVVPERYVSDYTPQERDKLYETFQQVAASHRRHVRAALCAGVGFASCCVLGALLLREPAVACAAIAFWLVMVGAAVTGPPLVCPGCDNWLETINRYCPECGGTPILRHGIFAQPECGVCGKSLRTSKHRTYRTRFCALRNTARRKGILRAGKYNAHHGTVQSSTDNSGTALKSIALRVSTVIS